MTRLRPKEPGEPNMDFARLADEETIARTAHALDRSGIRTSVVDTAADAVREVMNLLPDGAEVFTSTSTTLDTIGLSAAINDSPRFHAVHPEVLRMDRQTQGRAIRKLRAAPDTIVGSVHAITADGQLLIASASGSQLGPYAWTSARVIWVAGTQKLVANLEEGLRRIEEYCLPLENQRALRVYGSGSVIGKVLIVNREENPDRLRMILVREKLGF